MLKNLQEKFKHISNSGFSLLELLITLAIFAILIMIISELVILNLKVSWRVEARTKVREETSFLLKNLKKDIRNSISINVPSATKIELRLVDSKGIEQVRTWEYKTGTTGGYVDRIIDIAGTQTNDFRTPGDVDISSFNFTEGYSSGKNKLIIIDLQATTEGMTSGSYIQKRVGVSTRIF